MIDETQTTIKDVNELVSLIEAVLFWKGEPMSVKELAKVLEETPERIEESMRTLKGRLSGGVVLQELAGEYGLVTSPVAAHAIESFTKAEMKRDLGKAGLETLSIVLYRKDPTRADIDYIRGVSSQFILRNLVLRGLVERLQNPKDSRGFIYRPTASLLSFLGITSLDELPERGTLDAEMQSALDAKVDTTENTETDANDDKLESTPISD